MKSILFFSFCLICWSFLSTAQSPPIEWQHALGGTSGDDAVCAINSNDGGFIFVGYTLSNDDDVTGNHGGSDYWIVKLDSEGILQWQKCFGGTNDETPYHIINTIDGGNIICGYSNSNDGDVSGLHGNAGSENFDFWVVKTDSAANIQWQKMLGGSLDERAYNIIQTADSGFAVCGYSTSVDGDVTLNHGDRDYWVVKLDKNGNLDWQKSLGGSGNDMAWTLLETDDGYIVAGNSQSYNGDVTGLHGILGNADFWIVKLDFSGNIAWEKCIGGSLGEFPISMIKTTDNDVLISGIGSSTDGDVTGNHGQNDYWLIKINTIGDLLWEKSFGASYIDEGISIAASNDGGYLFSGQSFSQANGDKTCNSQYSDYWILKLDSTISIQWQKCLGGSNEDYLGNGIPTPDGGYLISGETYSSDGDITGFHGTTDAWIVKLEPDIATSTSSVDMNHSVVTLFPDPVISDLIFQFDQQDNQMKSIKIYDNLGNMIKNISASLTDVKLDFSMYPPGIYFAMIQDGNTFSSEKFIKQ